MKQGKRDSAADPLIEAAERRLALFRARLSPARLPLVGIVGTLALSLSLLACGSSAAAASTKGSGIRRDLSKALSGARSRTRAPAATAAAFHCGAVVWTGASGSKTLRSRPNVRPSTPFILASTTKTVTAAMILQLVQAGRLSLSEKLSHFYPKLPNASRITLRELLNMTSGLAEYSDNSKINHVMDTQPAHRWTRREIVAAIGRPQFRPGARYKYTNSNYVVLGGVIERTSRESVEQYFQAHIAKPLGMKSSTFVYAPKRSRDFAHPYTEEDNGSRSDAFARGVGIPSSYWGEVWTDGGLASTAPDLGRFLEGLFSGRLLQPKLLHQMTAVGPHDYGLGIYEKGFNHHHWLGHDGSYGGYESEDWHDAQRNVTISVLTNLSEPDSADYTISDRIWRAVAGAYDRSAGSRVRCRPKAVSG